MKPTFWEEVWDFVMKFGLRILAGAVLLFVGFRIAKWVARHIRTRQGKRASKVSDPLSPTMRSFLASAVGIGLRILIVILFIILMGANTSSVVAMLSSAALAIGLALQNSFSNLAGGLLIILFKPFGLGDYITVNGEAGTVQDINIYFTSILTPDNRTVVFPNGVMSNSTLVNSSTEETRRAEVQLPVAYAADSRLVCKLLEQAAAADERVLQDPAPQAALTDLLGGVQTYTIWAWCARTELLSVTYDLRVRAKETLEQHGIPLARARLDILPPQ